MAQILDRSITQGFYHTVACEDGGLDKNKIIKTEHRHHREKAWGEFGETPYEYSFFYGVNRHLTKLTDDVIFHNSSFKKQFTEEPPFISLTRLRKLKYDKQWLDNTAPGVLT